MNRISPHYQQTIPRATQNKTECGNVAGLLNKNNRKRTKRGKGGKREKCLTIFATNATGLKNKMQSFKNELNHVNAGVFTVQETHFKKKGIKVRGF